MTRFDPHLAERLAALSEEQQALLAARLAQLNAGDTTATRRVANPARLVAFVASRDGVEATDLRRHLEERLPLYMVPQDFQTLDALPRTPAGKIDRRALTAIARDDERPTPEPACSSGGSLTGTQRILADIWCDVLGLSEVGVDENFLELGGDSLLSIRVLARAGQQGFRISPEDFFEYPTIAGQAAVVSTRSASLEDQGAVSGKVALTPIQHWFFEHIDVDSHHWNQSLLFRVRRPLDLSVLERAVQALLAHHDALRIEFGKGADTEQRICEPNATVPVSDLDLRAVAADAISSSIQEHASALNAALDLSKGPLLRVALIRTGADTDDRLLLLAHHLIVDAVSWDLLLGDLERACEQAERDVGISLGTKTTSFKRWAESLTEFAQSDSARDGFEYWRAAAKEDFHLPLDKEATAHECRLGTLQTVTACLDAQQTNLILKEVPGTFNSTVSEVLLAALATAVRQWAGTPRIRFDLEGHGRDAPLDDLDVSRTAGWFTTVYPVVLSLPSDDDPVAVLTSVKEQLRAIPLQGLSYGLLRELSADPSMRSALRGRPNSELLFNYVGRTQLEGGSGRRLALEDDTCGVSRSPRGPLVYRVEINARVNGSRLEFRFGYSDAAHLEQTMVALADNLTAALRTLSNAMQSGRAAARTPSDFPLADLDQVQLDDIAHVLNAIDEDDSDGELE